MERATVRKKEWKSQLYECSLCVFVPRRLHCANDETNTTSIKHQNANKMRFICNIWDETVCPTAALKIFNIHFETFMMELRGRQQKPFHISIQTHTHTNTCSSKTNVIQADSQSTSLARAPTTYAKWLFNGSTIDLYTRLEWAWKCLFISSHELNGFPIQKPYRETQRCQSVYNGAFGVCEGGWVHVTLFWLHFEPMQN